MLYKDGAAYLKWIDAYSSYTDLGDFLGEQGTYELHLEVLSDTACLNPGRPRLIVYANRDEWDDWASPLLWISAFGLALGLSLISLALLTAKLELQDTRISDLASIAQSFQWAQKLPLGRQSSSLPAFALFAVPGLVILIVIFMFFEGMRPSTKGIYIHLLKPGHVAGDDESIVGNTPVVVRVADAGPGLTPRLYVNSTLTSWDKLADVLRDQLKLRPKWVIYVEADPNVTWTSAVNVMDVAKGLQARVVLLTGNQSPYPHAEQKKGRSQE